MPQAECTQLIRAWQGGDSHARDQLFQMIYPELRQIAARQLRQCNPGNTLNSTALVHELYAKLYNDRAAYESRNHFKAVAAKAMRHIITDHIRRNKAQKRGGDLMQTAMDTSLLAVNNDPHNTVEVLDLLDQLEVLGERFMTVVECRLFAGMTEDEIAQSLSVSRRTIQRDWAKAGRWRWQLCLQTLQRADMKAFLSNVLPDLRELPQSKNARWRVDVDPYEL